MTQSGTTTVSKAQKSVQEELPLEASLAPRGGVVVTVEESPCGHTPPAPRRGQRLGGRWGSPTPAPVPCTTPTHLQLSSRGQPGVLGVGKED